MDDITEGVELFKCWYSRGMRGTPSGGATHDEVNHPSHYTAHPSGIECIQVTEHMNFCLGNAVKYIWRAGEKDGTRAVTDLEKAAWYINREIERIKRESS